MSRKNDESPKTSRRHFTGMAISAAATSLAVRALVGANTQQEATSKKAGQVKQTRKATQECPVEINTTDDYTELIYGPLQVGEDHIPPMRIEGGGSVTIDFAHNLKRTGSGPYTYEEDGIDDEDRYGEIRGVFIVAEIETGYITKTEYSGFDRGLELRLWYQEIDQANPSGSNEVDYKPLPNPLPEADITIRGGRPGQYFQLKVKKKKLERKKSHKPHRPYRLKHTNGGGMPKHFRIGLWRFAKDNGATIVREGMGAENYTMYLDFYHFQTAKKR